MWLDYLIEVLELDWDERLEKDEENDDKNYTMLKESLFAIYLDDLRRDRKKPEKETLRALMAFADDDQSDNTVYREVFERELAINTSKNKRKRAETIVDLDNDQFGDYMDSWADDLPSSESDSSLPGSPTPQPKPRGRGRPPKTLRTPPQPPPQSRIPDGTVETIPLRLRLFRLLSAASQYLPDHLCNSADLYSSFSRRLLSLPPTTLRHFLESHATPLPQLVQISLLRTLADELLPAQRPDPNVHEDANGDYSLSWLMLEKCFLPFAATRVTAEDNARAALVLESMAWFVYVHGEEEAGGAEGVGEAVERGIAAREAKVAGKKRAAAGREGREEAVAKEVMGRAAGSLRVLVQVVGCV